MTCCVLCVCGLRTRALFLLCFPPLLRHNELDNNNNNRAGERERGGGRVSGEARGETKLINKCQFDGATRSASGIGGGA